MDFNSLQKTVSESPSSWSILWILQISTYTVTVVILCRMTPSLFTLEFLLILAYISEDLFSIFSICHPLFKSPKNTAPILAMT